MGKEDIVERILSDARNEADAIIKEAEDKAEKTLAAAAERAREMHAETEREANEKCASVRAGKEAAARLDSAKILLGEKRRVIDTVYAQTKEALLALDRKQTLALTNRLLEEYATEGDEVIFARDYPFAEDAAKLPVVKARKLKISAKRGEFSGGLFLRGKITDTDLSYSALLAEDREANQAELAVKLFGTK